MKFWGGKNCLECIISFYPYRTLEKHIELIKCTPNSRGIIKNEIIAILYKHYVCCLIYPHLVRTEERVENMIERVYGKSYI